MNMIMTVLYSLLHADDIILSLCCDASCLRNCVWLHSAHSYESGLLAQRFDVKIGTKGCVFRVYEVIIPECNCQFWFSSCLWLAMQWFRSSFRPFLLHLSSTLFSSFAHYRCHQCQM